MGNAGIERRQGAAVFLFGQGNRLLHALWFDVLTGQDVLDLDIGIAVRFGFRLPDVSPADTVNIVGTNAFVGDPLAADWDLNYKADDLYVGTVGGTTAAPTGSLYRLQIKESANPADWVLAERLTTNQPIVARPTLSVDKDLTRWVYVGTGRFYVNWEDSEQGGDYDQDMAGILRRASPGRQRSCYT